MPCEEIGPVVETVQLNGKEVRITKQSNGFTAWLDSGGCGRIPTIEEAIETAGKMLRNEPLRDYTYTGNPVSCYMRDGKLTEWLGAEIGTYQEVSSWTRYVEYHGNMTFRSIRGVIRGFEYHGRASDNQSPNTPNLSLIHI